MRLLSLTGLVTLSSENLSSPMLEQVAYHTRTAGITPSSLLTGAPESRKLEKHSRVCTDPTESPNGTKAGHRRAFPSPRLQAWGL